MDNELLTFQNRFNAINGIVYGQLLSRQDSLSKYDSNKLQGIVTVYDKAGDSFNKLVDDMGEHIDAILSAPTKDMGLIRGYIGFLRFSVSNLARGLQTFGHQLTSMSLSSTSMENAPDQAEKLAVQMESTSAISNGPSGLGEFQSNGESNTLTNEKAKVRTLTNMPQTHHFPPNA